MKMKSAVKSFCSSETYINEISRKCQSAMNSRKWRAIEVQIEITALNYGFANNAERVGSKMIRYRTCERPCFLSVLHRYETVYA